MIIILIFIPIIANAASHKVIESTEDIHPPFINVTTLYPVANITINKNVTEQPVKDKLKINATTWKIEAAFAESNIEEKNNKTEYETTTEMKSITTTESPKEQQIVDKNVSGISEFKPSQLLGTFYDISEEETPKIKTFETFTPVIKKPTAGFVSSPKDHNHIFNNMPKEIYQTHKEFPYKFENTIFTRARETWKHADSLESKPTAPIPVRVPAGGFYKSPDAFKEILGLYAYDGDYEMEHNGDIKENPIKKRANPWQSLLRLVTAFIPVGLIISALTPSIITVQSGPDNHYPSQLYRRSDTHISELAPISERCRRRLLCELHAERNYVQPQPNRRTGKQCYKLHCEDTQALSRMLHWLLTYHKPGADDQRGRHLT